MESRKGETRGWVETCMVPIDRFTPKSQPDRAVATLPRQEETKTAKYDETTRNYRIGRNQIGIRLE